MFIGWVARGGLHRAGPDEHAEAEPHGEDDRQLAEVHPHGLEMSRAGLAL